jgi:hypothetical protein
MHQRALPGGSQHESTYALPSVIPAKRLRYKGRICGIMRKIGGIFRSEERLDVHSSAGLEEGYVEIFPYNQELD